MGQLFSSNKNDYTPPRPPENREIFTGSSNFSYTSSSSMYTQPGVQTIPPVFTSIILNQITNILERGVLCQKYFLE